MSDKYAAIAAHRGQYPVRLMCDALGVSPSGFYAAQGVNDRVILALRSIR